MGGGDLNMKKHFHPLTMENLERVWKAEEKKRKEEERIEQLQKELHEERQRESFQKQAVESGLSKKKSEKLDWMYNSQQKVNTDEYLLGKRIDKNVEVMKEDHTKTLAEGAVSKSTSLPKAGDLLAKVKEDPLFLIKKREEDNRRDLVQNPLKMKKMKALLQQQMTEKEERKAYKKKKRHHRSPSSSPDKREDRNRKMRYTHESNGRHYRERSRERESHRDRNIERRNRERKTDERRRRHSSSSPESNRHRHQRKPIKTTRMKYVSKDNDSSSDDDMEKKRQEMMVNAKWRQTQRAQSSKRHKEEVEMEEHAIKQRFSNQNVDNQKAKFIRKMEVESFNDKNSSIEDRIRRNIHSKQRTSASQQKRFTSR